MRRRDFLSQLASLGCSGGLLGCTGCGTILHQERIGQPHSRDVDWKVAGFNGVGLALFFVPGVVAFAVDFYTGAIYLPPEFAGDCPQCEAYALQATPEADPSAVALSQTQTVPAPGMVESPTTTALQATRPAIEQSSWQDGGTDSLQRVMMPPGELDPQQIEEVVGDHIGQPVSLLDSSTRVSKLPKLDRFAAQWRQHARDSRFGLTSRAFFAKFLPS